MLFILLLDIRYAAYATGMMCWVGFTAEKSKCNEISSDRSKSSSPEKDGKQLHINLLELIKWLGGWGSWGRGGEVLHRVF